MPKLRDPYTGTEDGYDAGFGDVWGPEGPAVGGEDYQFYPPPDDLNTSPQNVQAPPSNTPVSEPPVSRWTKALERMPGWLQDEDSGVQSYMKNIYDSQEDPNSYIQSIVGSARQKGTRGEDDESVLRQLAGGGGPSSNNGGTGTHSSASLTPAKSKGWDEVFGTLKGLFPGGAFNQDVVNRRVSNARDQVQVSKRGATANNRAMLAERGLIGDGPEMTAMNRLDERMLGVENQAINDIYANESENADQRMMSALQLAAGMTQDEARLMLDSALGFSRLGLDRELGMGRLGLDRDLGMGGLAIDNMNSVNDYNLSLGRLGLDRDRLIAELENGDIDRLIQLIEQMYSGADTSAGGYY